MDPSGVTQAYVICARKAGAEVHRNSWVTGLRQRPDGTWDVDIDGGATVHAEHVVNAGGLWAREVGRMVGIELPVLAMEHHYLVTEDMPEVAANRAGPARRCRWRSTSPARSTSARRAAGCSSARTSRSRVPWSPKETPWDFGAQLLKPDVERIAPELQVAYKHFPAMGDIGIRRTVNGPFTFSPDGNPLVGPVRGIRNYWVACAVMAGLSQGGGVGLALATWMTQGDHGDSGMDIWAMDVARYGDYATLAYTNAKVRENYSRRFRITLPERGAAGRPAAPRRPRSTTA